MMTYDPECHRKYDSGRGPFPRWAEGPRRTPGGEQSAGMTRNICISRPRGERGPSRRRAWTRWKLEAAAEELEASPVSAGTKLHGVVYAETANESPGEVGGLYAGPLSRGGIREDPADRTAEAPGELGPGPSNRPATNIPRPKRASGLFAAMTSRCPPDLHWKA